MTMSKDKIWNTSSHEERQRIKAFWLSLSEEDRKRLVRIEKDAVLKKMKEQQRHSCSCQVCGRKRIAIEEELEVLYDAYYKELEEYANKQAAPPLLSESRRFGLLNGLHPPNRIPPALRAPRPFRRPARERSHDRGGQLEQYSDDLDDNEYSADDDIPSMRPPHADDFFNFGQSLTVKGEQHCSLHYHITDGFRWHTYRGRRPVEKRWQEIYRDDGAVGRATHG